MHSIVNATRIKGTYKINLEFENGEKKVFDFKEYVGGKSFIFGPLKNDKTFDLFRIEDGTIVWETGADFCPDVLYKNAKTII